MALSATSQEMSSVLGDPDKAQEPSVALPPARCAVLCPHTLSWSSTPSSSLGMLLELPWNQSLHPPRNLVPAPSQAQLRPCRLCCSRIPWECGLGAPQAACPCSCTWSWIPTDALQEVYGVYGFLYGVLFFVSKYLYLRLREKSFLGQLGLFRSVTRADVFWFWENIKSLLEIWEASVIL